jgi:magnesium chelatase subunit I
LRPQILDRFGLRLIVRGLTKPEDRLEAYRRAHAYLRNPRALINQYDLETAIAREEIQNARENLSQVSLPDNVAQAGLQLIHRMGIDSLRAEITLFEAARAYAAADNRHKVQQDDLRQVAPMALRLRRSSYMEAFFAERKSEEEEIAGNISEVLARGE